MPALSGGSGLPPVFWTVLWRPVLPKGGESAPGIRDHGHRPRVAVLRRAGTANGGPSALSRPVPCWRAWPRSSSPAAGREASARAAPARGASGGWGCLPDAPAQQNPSRAQTRRHPRCPPSRHSSHRPGRAAVCKGQRGTRVRPVEGVSGVEGAAHVEGRARPEGLSRAQGPATCRGQRRARADRVQAPPACERKKARSKRMMPSDRQNVRTARMMRRRRVAFLLPSALSQSLASSQWPYSA